MVRLHLNDQWQFLWHEIFCWLCLFEQKSEDHLKILWSWRVCGWNSLKKLFRDNKGLSPVNWDVPHTWDIRLRKVQSSQSCVLTQIIFWELPTRTEATVTGGTVTGGGASRSLNVIAISVSTRTFYEWIIFSALKKLMDIRWIANIRLSAESFLDCHNFQSTILKSDPLPGCDEWNMTT